jgi:hypothetical protein
MPFNRVPTNWVNWSLSAILIRVAVVLAGVLGVMAFLYIERRRTIINFRGWFVNECLPAVLLSAVVLAALVVLLSKM